MNRSATLLTLLAILCVSCVRTKLDDSVNQAYIEFANTFYTVYPGGSVDVYLGCSKAPDHDISIRLYFSGDAKQGEDFECPDVVTLLSGATSCSFTFKDKNLEKGKEIGITLKAPKGWKEGVNSRSVISVAKGEQLIYSFSYPEGVMHEALPISVSVIGTESGKDFVADEDIRFPLVCYGRLADKIEVPDLIIPKGKNSGSTIIRLMEPEWQGNEVMVIACDEEDRHFIPSNTNRDMKVFVRGMQSPEQLVGVWRFRTVIDIEEVEEWFSEMDDDPALLPTHNDGFTLEFRKEGDKVMLHPSGEGDFNWFFRDCEVTLTEPMNLTAHGFRLGNYTTFESNQFIADNLETYQSNTYYKLSVANRAFSADIEDLGPSTVVFRITINGELCLEFRDYDNASLFGENWWDPDKFDPDMFGFASRFFLMD